MSGRKLIIVPVLAAAVLAGPAQAVPLLCSVDQKFECGRDGCAPGLPGRIFNRIDPERGTYARCDAKGCTYPARFLPSGAFINVEISGHGAMARLSGVQAEPLRLDFLEVVTIGLAALVSYGTCSEDRP